MTALEELAVCATQRQGMPFIFGLDAIPDTWRHLGALTSLELRGNALLESLPEWLAGALPRLRLLDVSACSRLDLRALGALTQLHTLALQALDLVAGAAPPRLLAQAAAQGLVPRTSQLPDLSPLGRLRALNLADNNLGALPPCLLKLTALEVLDLSGNFFLEAPHPLTQLLAFKHLRCAPLRLAPRKPARRPRPGHPASAQPTLHLPTPARCVLPLRRHLDLRSVHVEEGQKFWSPAKCATMQHLAALAKSLRRRNRHAKVLLDTS